MSSELPPPSQEKEDSPDHESVFRRSLGQLFELIDDSGLHRYKYFGVTWDPDQSDRITDIKVANLMPTGARKQERKGEFYQAQFKAHEYSTIADERQKRYIWLPTDPQPLGTLITVNARGLHHYGYEALTPENVISAAAEHAVSIDNLIVLAEEIDQRGLNFPQLSGYLDRMMYSLVLQKQDPSKTADLLASDGMIHSFERLQGTGYRLNQDVQGRLFGRLLQSLVYSLGSGQEQDNESATRFIRVLQTGVISESSERAKRLYGNVSLYSYPFATDLLHERLTRGRERTMPKNAFGVERLDFVRDYMTSVLQGVLRYGDGEASSRQAVYSFLQTIPIGGRSKEFEGFDSWFRLADRLPVDPDEETEQIGPIYRPPMADMGDVSRAFLQVLDCFYDSDPDIAENQRAHYAKCAEVVDLLLRPILKKKLTQQMVNLTCEVK